MVGPLLLILSVLALLLWAFPTIATGSGHDGDDGDGKGGDENAGGNRGTIKVHDESTASPPNRNEPHVDCEDFWIEGFNMQHDGGEIVFYSWPPTGSKEEVLRVQWSADGESEKGTFHFLSGPHTLPPGHYRVEAFSTDGHPGGKEHFSKAKMFWVEECETGQPPKERPCPEGLVAASAEGGGVRLTWTPAKGSDGSNIYRAEGSEDFEFVASVGAGVGEYLDQDVENGVSYTYTVTALFDGSESTNCAQVEIVPIPELPTVLAVGLASVGGVVGYATMARRRKD